MLHKEQTPLRYNLPSLEYNISSVLRSNPCGVHIYKSLWIQVHKDQSLKETIRLEIEFNTKYSMCQIYQY